MTDAHGAGVDRAVAPGGQPTAAAGVWPRKPGPRRDYGMTLQIRQAHDQEQAEREEADYGLQGGVEAER
jgi:hypothetical protein